MHKPSEDSKEGLLIEVLKNPRNWLNIEDKGAKLGLPKLL